MLHVTHKVYPLRLCDGEICHIAEQQAHKKQQTLNVCSNAYPLALGQQQVTQDTITSAAFKNKNL